MGWERRGTGQYYYRKRRIGSRVVSEYVGAGDFAIFASMLDEEEREERRLQREAEMAQRRDTEVMTARVSRLADLLGLAADAALEQAGYHKHKGQWRRRRHGRPDRRTRYYRPCPRSL